MRHVWRRLQASNVSLAFLPANMTAVDKRFRPAGGDAFLKAEFRGKWDYNSAPSQGASSRSDASGIWMLHTARRLFGPLMCRRRRRT